MISQSLIHYNFEDWLDFPLIIFYIHDLKHYHKQNINFV